MVDSDMDQATLAKMDDTLHARHSGLGAAIHHLFVAIVVASIVTLAHHSSMLNWLDSIMLRIVAGMGSSTGAPNPRETAKLPVVFVIGDVLYERGFNQESPLDRNKLATLIDKVAAQCPSTLAIDLDLSPGPNVTTDMRGQASLDELLASIPSRSCPKPIELILTAPIRVQSSDAVAIKHDWMTRLCKKGIRFSFADAFLSRGAVIQFAPELPTLGVATFDPELREAVCGIVDQGADKAQFLRTSSPSAHREHLADYQSQLPLNGRFFAGESEFFQLLDSYDVLPISASGRTVFLGGGYGVKDRFVTPFDVNTPGV